MPVSCVFDCVQGDDSDGDVDDMVLDDILADTVRELTRLERDDEVTRNAVCLQDRPSLTTLYQRLEQMEVRCFHSLT